MKRMYIFLLCLIVMQATENYARDRIKLYALYTPSHEILKNSYFLPSLQDDFEIIFRFAEQTCPSAQFMSQGWTDTTIRKVDLIIDAIKENWDSWFIFSDVDIQFFAPIEDIITKLMQDKDIVMQRNNPAGDLCTGFFACRGNEKTLRLWTDVKKLMQKDKINSDQNSFNRCIKKNSKKNPYDVTWEYLPNIFFGGGTLTGKTGYLWLPGRSLPVPTGIVMHHANWTKGIKNKIAQLEYVRKRVRKQNKTVQLATLMVGSYGNNPTQVAGVNE